MTEIDWRDLPVKNWIQIFGYLDFKSLLNVTETCSKFAEIFDGSVKLNDKVRIVLDITNDLTPTLTIIQQSKRRYRNLKIIGIKENNNGDHLEIIYRYDWIKTEHAIKIGEIFGTSIVDLILNHFTSNFDLETLLASFKKLKVCLFHFIDSSFETDHIAFEQLYSKEQQEMLLRIPSPSVNIERITFYENTVVCMHIFRNSTNLRSLKFKRLAEPGTEMAETFVMKQKDLKELYFNDCSGLFKTKLVSEVSFQLEKFTLLNGNWENNENARDFFLSQKNLKSIELRFTDYDEEVLFNLFFKQILPSNKNLNRIFISTCLPKEKEYFGSRWPIVSDDNLITKIRSCHGIFSPNVTELEYEKGREEKTNAFMQSFVEIFPNLKILCLDFCLNKEELRLISSFEHLESLSFESKTSDLKEVQVTSKNLTTIKYYSKERPSKEMIGVRLNVETYLKAGYKIGEKLSNLLSCYSQEKSLANFEFLEEFLHRHPTIRHLSLNTPRISMLNLNFYPIDDILAKCLPNLESFCDKFTFIDPKNLKSNLRKLKMIRSLHIRVNEENQNEVREICNSQNIELKYQAIKIPLTAYKRKIQNFRGPRIYYRRQYYSYDNQILELN